MVEWFKERISHLHTRRIKDKYKYYFPKEAIKFIEQVLKEYGSEPDPNEGLVYICGSRSESNFFVKMIIAPKTISSYGKVQTSHSMNAKIVSTIVENNLIQIGQIHSHPGKFINHSIGDDEWTAFKVQNLISIVVPYFGKYGILPMIKCGVHRFQSNEFVRLPKGYVKKRFIVTKNDMVTKLIDLRNE